jgi:hypothetical protein
MVLNSIEYKVFERENLDSDILPRPISQSPIKYMKALGGRMFVYHTVSRYIVISEFYEGIEESNVMVGPQTSGVT